MRLLRDFVPRNDIEKLFLIMKTISKYIFALLFLYLAFSYCGNQSSGKKISDKDKILATINEEKISLLDLKKDIKILPDEYRIRIRTPEEKKTLLQDLVTTNVLFLAGKGKNLDKDEYIKLKLKNLEKSLVRDLYINKFIVPKSVPTNEEIVKYYDQHKKDQFLIKGYVEVKYIQLSTLKEAQEIYEKLEKKIYKFEDVVRKFSTYKPPSDENPPTRRVYIDEDIPGIGKDKEFIKAAFSLKPGEISRPIKTKSGYHIVTLIFKKDDSYTNFEFVRDNIKKFLTKDKFIRLMDTEIADLKKKYNVKTYPELLE